MPARVFAGWVIGELAFQRVGYAMPLAALPALHACVGPRFPRLPGRAWGGINRA